jgi:aspartyl protease family protein
MKGFVFTVLAIGALVALAAPHGDGSASKSRPVTPAATADVQLAAATTPEWSGGDMALGREPDGHFYAEVKVDGSDYRMLVDTGATVVALTGDDAQAMDLDWDANALAPVARGAGGVVYGVKATIPDMAVGDFEARNVQAVIIPEGLGISLLGQSFLTHVPKVAIADDKLVLSD